MHPYRFQQPTIVRVVLHICDLLRAQSLYGNADSMAPVEDSEVWEIIWMIITAGLAYGFYGYYTYDMMKYVDQAQIVLCGGDPGVVIAILDTYCSSAVAFFRFCCRCIR